MDKEVREKLDKVNVAMHKALDKYVFETLTPEIKEKVLNVVLELLDYTDNITDHLEFASKKSETERNQIIVTMTAKDGIGQTFLKTLNAARGPDRGDPEMFYTIKEKVNNGT